MRVSLEDLPIEILQAVVLDLPDTALASFLATSRAIRDRLFDNRQFWRAKLLQKFDAPLFEDTTKKIDDIEENEKESGENGDKAVVTKTLTGEESYDYRGTYQNRVRVLRQRPFRVTDMGVIIGMVAEHRQRNYKLLEASGLLSEFMFHQPRDESALDNEEQMAQFQLIKSILMPAAGFPGIVANPLDPIYRIVYNSPRHPLFSPETGLPNLHVVAAIVTFWQMMNMQSALRRYRKGMDPIETLHTLRPSPGGSVSVANESFSSPGDGSEDESEDGQAKDPSEREDDPRLFIAAYAFFNYWDFELFRSAPLTSDTRRSIIGDIVDWHIDLPDEISGPISLRVEGTSHQLTGLTEERRCVIEIEPIDVPVMGVRGWARFSMRHLEFELEGDYFEEQRWIHRAVMLPGSKAVVGRWHDGFDEDTERSVEGPAVWIRQ
ncbi:hypothetical protein BZA70DRAFT_267086 [Myxozyma melibiosi]|uniref:F-box domain-containing protein n=1 Tax=Myxozyma melibiosi TaxID=54550 RepID=A0ABR1F824_9ASCO